MLSTRLSHMIAALSHSHMHGPGAEPTLAYAHTATTATPRITRFTCARAHHDFSRKRGILLIASTRLTCPHTRTSCFHAHAGGNRADSRVPAGDARVAHWRLRGRTCVARDCARSCRVSRRGRAPAEVEHQGLRPGCNGRRGVRHGRVPSRGAHHGEAPWSRRLCHPPRLRVRRERACVDKMFLSPHFMPSHSMCAARRLSDDANVQTLAASVAVRLQCRFPPQLADNMPTNRLSLALFSPFCSITCTSE
jgi:hypothetical protein